MQLTHFSFKEISWTFEPLLPLQEISLLHNRNTVGKLRVMEDINSTINFILHATTISNNKEFSTSLKFEDQGESFTYSFTFARGEVIAEELGIINQEPFLIRDKEKTLLHKTCISPPSHKLVLHSRRDTIQYPYIEKIMYWAEHAHVLSFNNTNIAFFLSNHHRVNLQFMVEALSETSLDKVINQAHRLGYTTHSIEAIAPNELHAIYLLVYMEYISSKPKPSILLIENLCEGLDYDRSIQLGSLLFSFCLNNGIQLIVSSNNTYLINTLEAKYWNILLQKGKHSN